MYKHFMTILKLLTRTQIMKRLEFYNEIDISDDNNILNSQRTFEEINKMISKCNNSKAVSSQDYIYNEYIKNTRSVMIDIYQSYFNVIFDSGLMSDVWLIVPIFKKKGYPLDPENYNPKLSL